MIKEYIRQGGKENKGSESTKTGWKGGYGKCCIGRREGIGSEEKGRLWRLDKEKKLGGNMEKGRL